MVAVMVNHVLVVIDGSHWQGAGGTVVHSHLLDMHDHLMPAESSRRRHREPSATLDTGMGTSTLTILGTRKLDVSRIHAITSTDQLLDDGFTCTS
jgi:hypothetical protein